MDRRDRLVHNLSPPQSKIALFRALFRGRDDVYPRRFESRRTGNSGYSPACGNEWAQDLCEKPRIKCSACPHQHFLADNSVRPISDEINPTLYMHLVTRNGREQAEVPGQ
jgi:hypothetical protein